MDNIFIERLWRSLKYEEVYIHAYARIAEAKAGIGAWLCFYNDERQHQSHGAHAAELSVQIEDAAHGLGLGGVEGQRALARVIAQRYIAAHPHALLL
jgi:hypothetical protein